MAFPDALLWSSSAPSSSSCCITTPRSNSRTSICTTKTVSMRNPSTSFSSLNSISSNPKPPRFSPLSSVTLQRRFDRAGVHSNASKKSSGAPPAGKDGGKVQEVEEEVEVELSWVEEKVEDLAQYTSGVVNAIPGPRVGGGELPWLLALPLGYVALSLVIAVVKTVRKYISKKGKRKRLVGKNAWLVETLSEYLPEKREELDSKKLKNLAGRAKFETEEVLRKYIRYALNERPFDPETVADLIHLRKISMLDDREVAEVLNEVSRRIVKAMGPVIADTTGFTERGLKRKIAVQALFSKILYLSELDEFCSTSSLTIKEIFGVTDEDANQMRIETLSGETEVESFEELVDGLPSEVPDEEL